MGFVFRWAVLTLAVWASTYVIRGVTYDTWQNLLVAALVLGILNTLVKPALVFISLPAVILSLGLFLVIINALLLMLTARLVEGFHVAGFWPAVGASLMVSAVSMLLGAGSRRRPAVRTDTIRFRRQPDGPPSGKGPIIDV
jgi:putative membrane protein